MKYKIQQAHMHFEVEAVRQAMQGLRADLTIIQTAGGALDLEFEIDDKGFITDPDVASVLAQTVSPNYFSIAHMFNLQTTFDTYIEKLNEVQLEELAFLIFTKQIPALIVRVNVPRENVEEALLRSVYISSIAYDKMLTSFDDLKRLLINTFNLNISSSDAEKMLVRVVTRALSNELIHIEDPNDAVQLVRYLIERDALPAQLLEVIPRVAKLSLYRRSDEESPEARNQLFEYLKGELFQAFKTAQGELKEQLVENIADVVSKHLEEGADPRAIVLADMLDDRILKNAAKKKLDHFLSHSREKTKEIGMLFFYLGNDRFTDSVVQALAERPKSVGGLHRNLEFRHDGIWLGTLYSEAGLIHAYVSDLLEKLVKEYAVGEKYTQNNLDNFYDAFISTAAALREGKEPFFSKSDAQLLPLNQLPKLLKHGAMDKYDIVDIVIERTNIPESKREAYKLVLIDLIEARASELSDFVFELKGQELI